MRRSRLRYATTKGKKRKRPISIQLILTVSVVLLLGLQMVLFVNHTSPSSKSAPLLPVEDKVESPIIKEDMDGLPNWITDYIAWHNEVRAKYPGKKLFEDPEAPNTIIRVCLGLCGGLNDRLGQLPWDLYLANQTGRVLFMNWSRPKALENFLLPNAIDWSLPSDLPGFGFDDMREIRTQTQFFEGADENRPTDDFWKTHLDMSIERARSGKFKDVKILRHILLGHLNEDVLEKRLRDLGETDMLHWTPSFGKLWWAFFKPSPPVQEELDKVYRELKIEPGQYSAVHCRVRHPKATPLGVFVKGKNPNYPADKTGLPWTGDTRNFAVSIGTHALQCARTLSKDAMEPIYFFADSNDLVRYMAHELPDPNFVKSNATLFQNPVDQAALAAVNSTRILAREMSEENAHIDRQKGRDPPAYYATFVDLLLAVNARCVTYGIGFYAIFATKISGTQCKLVYQEEEWGGKMGGKAAPLCTAETYKYLQ